MPSGAFTQMRRCETLAGLGELLRINNRTVKSGKMLGATERETEPYSMYGEYWSDRATKQIAAFHGAAANPAKLS